MAVAHKAGGIAPGATPKGNGMNNAGPIKAIEDCIASTERTIEAVERKRKIRNSERAAWIADLKMRLAHLHDALRIVQACTWRVIPPDGDIDHNDCVLVRRPKVDGTYSVAIGYKSVAAGWRVDNGTRPVTDFKEWCPIVAPAA